MDVSIIAKAIVGKALVRSREADQHVAMLLGAQRVAIGLLSSQLAELAARPFAIECEGLGLAWGGLICVIHARSAQAETFQIAREARMVTALLELDDAAIAYIDSGKIAAVDVGAYEDQPAEVLLFAEATVEALRARCTEQGIGSRSAMQT